MADLPLRPSLDQLKHQAKELLAALKRGDPEALRRVRAVHPKFGNSSDEEISGAGLREVQLAIAREYGFATWNLLSEHVQTQRANQGDRAAAVNALLKAAGDGNAAEVARLLDRHPNIIDERGGDGTRTALHYAALGAHEEVVKLLLDRGANPNIRDVGDLAFPLHFAAEKEHMGIIRLLVEHGADTVGFDDFHKCGVLGWCVCLSKANPEVVAYLLAHGAKHNVGTATVLGDLEVLRELAARNPADLDEPLEVGNRYRPLHLAVTRKQPRSLATLLDLGADIEAPDSGGLTALDVAAFRGEADMARTLIERGARVSLPAALALGREDDVARILRAEPDCLKPGGRWGTLIVRAAESGDAALVERLLTLGASVNTVDDPATSIDHTDGYTALHAAGWHGKLEVIALLMRHGADVRLRDSKYTGSPASWANYAGQIAARDLIVQGPIDPIQATAFGLPDRVAGILANDPGALNRPLAAYLTDKSSPNAWLTPLAHAVVTNKPEMVRVFLHHGADAAVRHPDGRWLVQVAKDAGYGEIAELLGRHGAPGN
jgi:ankyrin repeat protein